MGYQILANQEKVHYGVKSFVVDTLNDIKKLPNAIAGSTAYCIETQKKYIKDTKGNWRIAPSSGSTAFGDLTNVDLVFDGTEITNSSDSLDDENTVYVWDGGVVAPNTTINADYIWDGGTP